MAKFYSFSDRRPIEYAPQGNSIVQEYELEYSPQGVPHLIPVGTYDLYDVIQSFKDECDLGKIFQRYANGDVMALNKRQGVYADISGLPGDVFAANSMIKRVREIYDSLEESTRANYASFEDFVSNPFAAFTDSPSSDAGHTQAGVDSDTEVKS
jgi:hypothetical protein